MEKKVRIKRSSGLVGLCIMVICLVMFMNRKTYAEQGDYMLKVNVASGCITVYEKGGNGEYNVAVKAFSCSTDDTIVKLDETYSITGQQEWKKMSDGTYSQYVMELSMVYRYVQVHIRQRAKILLIWQDSMKLEVGIL